METADTIQADEILDVIIVGGGPAGATAALYTARADLRTLVLDKSVSSGALGMTTVVDNYPGVPHTTGADLVEAIRRQAESFGAVFRKEAVQAANLEGDIKEIYATQGTYRARAVILATGSMGRAHVVPGEETLTGRGVSYCATCDAAFFRGRRVAVVGNTDYAAEEALFLARFAARVTLVHGGKEPKVTPELLAQLQAEPKLDLRSGRLLAVLGDESVTGVRVSGPAGEEQLMVDGVFIFLQGNKPVTDYLMGAVPTTADGCVIADNETFETRVPGVYAVGDLLCKETKQAVIAAAEGCGAAIHVDKYLRGRKLALHDWR